MTHVIIVKNDHHGEEVWRYDGTIVERGPTWIKLEAIYTSPDRMTDYHTFRQGDRFVEWFYSDRWYSIFQMHDVDDDRLKGWYCNISRPAVFANGVIAADDLALDLFVAPDGTLTVLDEDEFEALPLDPATRRAARDALAELRERVTRRQTPFEAIYQG